MESRPIVINGRFLAKPVTGVQRFARELVRALDQLIAETGGLKDEFLLVAPVGTACDLELRAVRFVQVGTRKGHLWEQLDLARFARGKKLVSLCNSGPFLSSRQVVVIHDAAVYRKPELFSRKYGLLHRLLGRALAMRAKIATVSNFSADELSKFLSLDRNEIAVIPNGTEHISRVQPDQTVLTRLQLAERPFFLSVGALSPNKNVQLALKAIRLLPDAQVMLVVVGGMNADVFGTQPELLDPRLVMAGRVTDGELRALYSAATALIFPSRYEGFGIPPLEAFSNGCRVIASDIPPVREVCGDLAAYIGPDDAAGLCKLMENHLMACEKEEMRILRLAKAANYSWSKSAKLLLEML